jgi:NAD+ kinase
MTLIKPFDKKFNKIGIIAKRTIGEELPKLKKIIKAIKKFNKKLFLDERTAPLVDGSEGYTKHELFNKCDMIMLLGGDGTILKSAANVGKKITPVLGVNMGNLGFLSEATPESVNEALEKIFNGKYQLDKRSILRVTKYHEKKKVDTFLAMNDAVINQGIFARLIEMKIEISQKKVVSFSADGLILSTPTGSTAHSLSAGGPIVNPDLDAIIVTPICPSTLALRPLVIPNNKQVRTTIITRRRGDYNLGLTIDGQTTIPLEYGDQVNVRKSSRNFYMIRVTDQNYYKLLREKLGWGCHTRA